MGPSFQIARLFNIPIKLHWSFSLIVLFVAYIINTEGLNVEQSCWFVLYFLSIFCCVIMHEYGHALTARRYNVATKDIILSPIGGIARLERIPHNPLEEFIVAIAGPLVNVAIAIIVILIMLLVGVTPSFSLNENFELVGWIGLLQLLLLMNGVLFLFNLIPAFPMDGGRILRSLLSIPFTRMAATRIAAWIGRILAIGFVVYATVGSASTNPVLMMIGVFIFFMASNEFRQVSTRHFLTTRTVQDIYQPEIHKVYLNDKLNTVVKLMKETKTKSFLIYDSQENLKGSLPYEFIKHLQKEGISEEYVIQDDILNKLEFIHIDTFLEKAFYKMNHDNVGVLIVVNSKLETLGILDRQKMKSAIQKYVQNNWFKFRDEI